MEIEEIPAGVYSVRFMRVKAEPKPGSKTQQNWRWTWGISAGPYRGRAVHRLTTDKPRDNNQAGRLARQVTAAVDGEALPASQFVPSLYEGEPMTLWLEDREGGTPMVAQIMPARVLRRVAKG